MLICQKTPGCQKLDGHRSPCEVRPPRPYTPTTDEVRDAFAGHDFDQAIAGAQFDRWLAEVERAVAEKAVANVRSEIRQIPRWWNSEQGYGEFDLQPLGPNETSEKGAYMEVMRVLDECAAALGLTAGQEGERA